MKPVQFPFIQGIVAIAMGMTLLSPTVHGAPLQKLKKHGHWQNIGDLEFKRIRLNARGMLQRASNGSLLTAGVTWNPSYRFHKYFKVGVNLGVLPVKDYNNGDFYPVFESYLVPALWMGILYAELGIGGAYYWHFQDNRFEVVPAGMLNVGVRLREWIWDLFQPGLFLGYAQHIMGLDVTHQARVGLELGF